MSLQRSLSITVHNREQQSQSLSFSVPGRMDLIREIPIIAPRLALPLNVNPRSRSGNPSINRTY